MLTFVNQFGDPTIFNNQDHLLSYSFSAQTQLIFIMDGSQKTGIKIGKKLLNKYLIVFVVFTVLLTFFDDHSLIHRWQTYRRIVRMEKELKYYQDEIDTNRQKRNELQSSNENLEKFAREHYFMKKENEDIFIIKE